VFAFATLHDALKGNQFRLDAQPIHALADVDSILGYEILVRMRNEAGDLVAPDKFMAAARRYHLTPALDRWVLCSTLDVVTDRAHQIPPNAMFAVNVTAQSVSNESFREFLLEQLRESKLPPESFCLEIAESAAVANLRQAEALIREVTELGCTVALDDFGAGLSSLAHLKSLPVDYLKIDGSFVRRILTDQFAESMVLAIAQAAKTLGIQTIAEHVEEEAVAVKLRGLGVDYAQGYFFARPQSLARVLAELSPLPVPTQASA
jgi:Amt family ammonium transporter